MYIILSCDIICTMADITATDIFTYYIKKVAIRLIKSTSSQYNPIPLLIFWNFILSHIPINAPFIFLRHTFAEEDVQLWINLPTYWIRKYLTNWNHGRAF